MTTPYFVFTDAVNFEAEALKQVQPEHLLLSYWHFKTKGIQYAVDKLGYVPTIMLDSGAWSAWNKNKNIAPTDYMNFVTKYRHIVGSYVSLDVIGDDELSKRYYDIMLYKGFEPIPVFHYGGDITYLDYYVDSVEPGTSVALGGTAAMKDKKVVREWVQSIERLYPDQAFHLLGSSSQQIMGHCNLASCDASTWIMMSVNGFPKEIKGRDQAARRDRGIWQIRKLTEDFNEDRADQLHKVKAG